MVFEVLSPKTAHPLKPFGHCDIGWVLRYRYLDIDTSFKLYCVVPDNIPTHPKENSEGEGVLNSQTF